MGLDVSEQCDARGEVAHMKFMVAISMLETARHNDGLASLCPLDKK